MKQPCFSLLPLSVVLLSLLIALGAWTANARKDSGDYWKGVMKDEPMPSALEALILPIPHTSSSHSLVKKPDCHHEDPNTSSSSGEHVMPDSSHAEGKPFGHDIEPRPSVTAAYAGEGTGETLIEGKLFSIEKPEQTPRATVATISSKSYEPRASVTSYQGSGFVLVVEQNPSMASSNKGDKTDVVVQDLPVAESFEPRPNVSAYGD